MQTGIDQFQRAALEAIRAGRAMLDAADAHGIAAVGDLPLLDRRPELRRGVDLLTARLSRHFTRFDGNLTAAGDADLRGVGLPSPLEPSHVTSATMSSARSSIAWRSTSAEPG